MEVLRRIGLKATQLANATCGTIRVKLLKIGAWVQTSIRCVKVAMASAHPGQREWVLAYHALGAALRHEPDSAQPTYASSPRRRRIPPTCPHNAGKSLTRAVAHSRRIVEPCVAAFGSCPLVS